MESNLLPNRLDQIEIAIFHNAPPKYDACFLYTLIYCINSVISGSLWFSIAKPEMQIQMKQNISAFDAHNANHMGFYLARGFLHIFFSFVLSCMPCVVVAVVSRESDMKRSSKFVHVFVICYRITLSVSLCGLYTPMLIDNVYLAIEPAIDSG